MAKTSDILLIAAAGFALTQVRGIASGLSDICLNPLGCGDQDTTVKEEIRVTEKYSCTCADGFKMSSDSGNCIEECEALGHGTQETIIGEFFTCPDGSRLPSQNRTYSQTCGCPDGFVLDNDGHCTRTNVTEIISERVKVTCPDGTIIDVSGLTAPEQDAIIKDRCGLNCPPPYFYSGGKCTTQQAGYIPGNIIESPEDSGYEDFETGKTWMDAPELQGDTAPAFLNNNNVHTPPEISGLGYEF